MSLDISGTASNRISLGTPSALTDLWIGSCIVWVNFSSVTADQRIWQLGSVAVNKYSLWQIRTDSKLDFQCHKSGGDMSIVSSTTFATGQWYCLATTWNVTGSTTDNRHYWGTPTASLVEVSYTSRGMSTGTTVTQSGEVFYIGNNRNFTVNLEGSLAFIGFWNYQLTIEEMIAQQFSPRKTAGNILFMYPGSNGLDTQPDWSGNVYNGTVTGCAVGDGISLIPWFGYDIPRYTVRITGTTVWGQTTGTSETNVRTFATNWTGTGEVTGSGDSESICLDAGEYMESELINTGTFTVELSQNVYASGDTVTIKYKTGATQADCLAASWTTYSTPFDSLGFVQVRIESTL